MASLRAGAQCGHVAASSARNGTPSMPRAARLAAPRRAGPAAAAAAPKSFETGRARPLRAVRADQVSAVDATDMQLIADVTKVVDERLAATTAASAEAARSIDLANDSALRGRLAGTIAKVEKGLLERETEVRLMMLAALCGEHLLLLGPPGTAKSELSRRLSKVMGGTYFERLLTRFSVPEELFGPLSMRGLENDEYVRQTAGYLPTAEVAFVDEIFKANSAILNALLTLLNERLFDNGNQRLEAPLMCLVGASNELPESEELDALYDRFLLRRNVAQVSNSQVPRLARLAAGRAEPAAAAGNGGGSSMESTDGAPCLEFEDFKQTAISAYSGVDVPDAVIDILVDLRNWLQDKSEPPIYVSDRRFMKSVQMLQVVAFADGRSEVNEYDALLLENVFGNRPDDSVKVRTKVLDIIASDPGLQQTELVFLGLFGRACRLLESTPSAADAAEAAAEAATLVELLEARQAALAAALDGQFPELRATVWQSEASVQAAVQALTPQMTENRRKAEDLLREAYTLAECLQRRCSAQVLEKLLPKRYKQYTKGISGKTA
ncbi:MAG: AAA domain-containing protein [Monoraphidium minutum]|nr:MAG: AAA domain-containing protein [Monoraphidium minutum]